jgi:hypothetical protein
MRPIFILTLLLNTLGFLQAQEALLVEVFTYDGCSHCMLANRALRNLENDTALKREIIILTHHVDYDKQDNFYDSLDHPFSRLRQNELVERGLCSGIFTPQAVLGGKTCFAISGRKQLIDKINSFSLDTAELKAAVNLRKVGAGFSLDVELRNLADTAWQINLVLLQSSRSVSPYSGENAGATLQHSNCLLEAQRFNYREGFSETFQLPQSVLAQPEKFALLFFLQHEKTSEIRLAEKIALNQIR